MMVKPQMLIKVELHTISEKAHEKVIEKASLTENKGIIGKVRKK